MALGFRLESSLWVESARSSARNRDLPEPDTDSLELVPVSKVVKTWRMTGLFGPQDWLPLQSARSEPAP